MRAERLIGVLVALIALGGGGFAAWRVTEDARASAVAEATRTTQATASNIVAALKALPEQLLPVAQSAAATKGLGALLQADTDFDSLDDFMRTEAGWKPFRSQGSTGVFIGDELKALTGDKGDVLAAGQLAHEAQGRQSAGALIDAADHVLIVAAARSAATPNSQSTSVTISRPLAVADLEPIASKFGAAIAVSAAQGEKVAAGQESLRPRLGSDQLGSLTQLVIPGVTLQVASDVSAIMTKATENSATPRTIAWVISGLVALAALAFAFWPRPQTELLKETTNELARSREELVRLSAKITSSQNLDGSPIQLTEVDSGLMGATSRTHTSGRYEILAQLGEGGMAKVYVAVSRGAEGFQRSFVIKRLRAELIGNAEAVGQFIDEGRLGASLVHSNIVPVLDFGRDHEGYYLAQEYILGRSIDRLVEGSMQRLGQPLSPRVVLYLAQESLKALAYAHGKADDDGRPMGLVHRDVSPSNLMISQRGEVKLLDFGIVKSEHRLTKTQTGMVKGNLFFMSPEQAQGLVVDARSDLFSLGMVLLTASLGTTLYTGTTSYELLNRAGAGLTDADLGTLRGLALGGLLEKALKRDPTERYGSADEFAKAVAAVGTPATAAEVGEMIEQLFGEELAKETATLREAKGKS